MTDASTELPVHTGWFEAAHFGLFVHFGLYSLAARHEWVRSREAMSQQEYDRYLHKFDPDFFDARQLASTAGESGIRYAVLTAKHHDGFCLFGSALSDYTSVRATGRDMVREFVDAMHAEGLRVGLYYSLLDWHHPDFTVDEHHPLRDTAARQETRDMARYRAYMEGQIRELLTDYGRSTCSSSTSRIRRRARTSGVRGNFWISRESCSPAFWSTTGSAFPATT